MMARYTAVLKSSHATRRWQRYSDYGFARMRAIVPLIGAELASATLAFPIAFLSEEGTVTPVAVMSLDPEQNLFVGPDGRWLGSYVPAAFRSHPFALLPDVNGDLVLCIDEDSNLMSDAGNGEAFFEADGSASEPTRKVLDFLIKFQAGQMPTTRACTALQAAALIVPWEITVRNRDGEQRIAGLHKIDEVRMNALPTEEFDALRQAGAVAMAYCQILSMQHLAAVGRLADAHAAQREEAGLIFEQSFSPKKSAEIDIDWNIFADEGLEKDNP